MGKTHETISDSIKAWVEAQHMFFVATAPLASDGHVNCSPKGIDSLRIIGPKEVVYQDLTGGGAGTIAHVQENSRIIDYVMCGDGSAADCPFSWNRPCACHWVAHLCPLTRSFPERIDCRAYISVDVTRVGTSCGYAVRFSTMSGSATFSTHGPRKKVRRGWPLIATRKMPRALMACPACRLPPPQR